MTLKQDASRVAVLTAVRDAIDAELRGQRAGVFDQLVAAQTDYGVKSIDVTLPDGTKVATATIVEPHARVAITNEAAFTKWVEAQWPDQIEPRVRPAFLTALLERFKSEPEGGDVFDTTTGALVDGATGYPPRDPSTFALRFTPGGIGRDAIINAWRSGDLTELAGTPAPAAIEA